MTYKTEVTDPSHYSADMLLHLSTRKGYGAIIKDSRGYVVVWSHYGGGGDQFLVHTWAWAKRMLRKHIGASW